LAITEDVGLNFIRLSSSSQVEGRNEVTLTWFMDEMDNLLHRGDFRRKRREGN